jgi:hypothetical protein
VDAAIATAAALGLTTPAMTGLGGDMFMLFYDAETKTVRSINGSGRCAAALTPERVRADLEATGGGAGVAEGTWGNGARTRSLLMRHLICTPKNESLYQDRLGTNVGEKLRYRKKDAFVSQGSHRRTSVATCTRSPYRVPPRAGVMLSMLGAQECRCLKSWRPLSSSPVRETTRDNLAPFAVCFTFLVHVHHGQNRWLFTKTGSGHNHREEGTLILTTGRSFDFHASQRAASPSPRFLRSCGWTKCPRSQSGS